MELKLTEEKIQQAKDLLKEVEQNNGYLMIAKACGITRKEVSAIHKLLLKEIGEATPIEVEQDD